MTFPTCPTAEVRGCDSTEAECCWKNCLATCWVDLLIWIGIKWVIPFGKDNQFSSRHFPSVPSPAASACVSKCSWMWRVKRNPRGHPGLWWIGWPQHILASDGSYGTHKGYDASFIISWDQRCKHREQCTYSVHICGHLAAEWPPFMKSWEVRCGALSFTEISHRILKRSALQIWREAVLRFSPSSDELARGGYTHQPQLGFSVKWSYFYLKNGVFSFWILSHL